MSGQINTKDITGPGVCSVIYASFAKTQPLLGSGTINWLKAMIKPPLQWQKHYTSLPLPDYNRRKERTYASFLPSPDAT